MSSSTNNNGLQQHLILMSGVPGSGKSTEARKLADSLVGFVIHSTDNYFVDAAGVYRFDPKKLAKYHEKCKVDVIQSLAAGKSVIVDNTHIKRWEREIYFALAKLCPQIQVQVIFIGPQPNSNVQDWLQQCFLRCTHEVPLGTIQRMYQEWERDK